MVLPFKRNVFSSTFTWWYLLNAVLKFQPVEEILWCNHTKPLQQFFHMAVFILYNDLYVNLTFESVNEILWCDHSNETS